MVGKSASLSGKGSRCVDSRVCPSKKDFKVLQAFQANSVEQVSSPSVVAIVLTFIFVTIYVLNSSLVLKLQQMHVYLCTITSTTIPFQLPFKIYFSTIADNQQPSGYKLHVLKYTTIYQVDDKIHYL